MAPEGEQYLELKADAKEHSTVNCLPDMRPVYLKIKASEMKSPIQFDIRMGNINAL